MLPPEPGPIPAPSPEPMPVPLPLPIENPFRFELGTPRSGILLSAIFKSFCTTTLGSTASLGGSTGGALGGTICSCASLGRCPCVTGVGPFWPPPPPIFSALGATGGGGGEISIDERFDLGGAAN